MWADAVDAEIHATVCGDSTKPTIPPQPNACRRRGKIPRPGTTTAPPAAEGEEGRNERPPGLRTCRQR